MVVLRASAAWLAAFASLVGACGGKSVSLERESGDDSSLGGSSRGGGVSSGGGPQGRGGTSPAGGGPLGGGVGPGGVPATGGAGVGGAGIGGQGGAAGDECPPGIFTTIVGTVRDPSGTMPLYNVMVYEPSGRPAPFHEGIECGGCLRIEPRPRNGALTDTTGRFRLTVSTGGRVPVVVQTGKWRREVTVGPVTPCVDNEVTNDDLFRLPRSRAEGHLPRIAVVTGREDSPECLLRRLGISDREFTTDAGSGAVNLFAGCVSDSGTGADHFTPALGGAAFPPTSALVADPAKLARYDMVLFGCEGTTCSETKQPYQANVEGYANGGGRLFLNHLQNYWIQNGSANLRATGVFAEISNPPLRTLGLTVDQTFPKGQALAQWLVDVGASDTQGTVIVRDAGFSLLEAVPPARRWLYAPGEDSGLGVFTTTVSTPIAIPEYDQCGRITFTDFHAWTPEGDRSEAGVGFPDGCRTGRLSPQEAAFAFQLFDYSSCVESGPSTPMPPGP